MVTVLPRSSADRAVSESNSRCQPDSQWAINSSRVVNVSTNSSSRFRQGFSPSVVRKSVHRESKFPATCFMMTAMLLVLGSRATCSLSSGSWAIALSAQPLWDRNAARAPSIMALPTSALSAVMGYLHLKTSSRTDRRSRDAERRRVTDLALDAFQGTRHEFDGHE